MSRHAKLARTYTLKLVGLDNQSSDPNWHISQFAHYSNIQYLSLLVVSIAALYIIATEECIEDKDETVLSCGDPCIYH